MHHESPQNATPPPTEQRVIGELLRGQTITESAAVGGVAREIVHRWMREDFVFQASYNEGRRELQDALLAAQPGSALGMRHPSSKTLIGSMITQTPWEKVMPTKSAENFPTCLGCVTCTAMCGNGVETGTRTITHKVPMPKRVPPHRTACFGAGVGMIEPKIAVRPNEPGCCQSSEATSLDSVWPW